MAQTVFSLTQIIFEPCHVKICFWHMLTLKEQFAQTYQPTFVMHWIDSEMPIFSIQSKVVGHAGLSFTW